MLELWPQLALSGSGIGAMVAVIRWIMRRSRDPQASQPPLLVRFIRWVFRTGTLYKQLALRDAADAQAIVQANQLRSNLKWADEMIELLQNKLQWATDELKRRDVEMLAKDQEIAHLRSELAASNASSIGSTGSGGETTRPQKP